MNNEYFDKTIEGRRSGIAANKSEPASTIARVLWQLVGLQVDDGMKPTSSAVLTVVLRLEKSNTMESCGMLHLR